VKATAEAWLRGPIPGVLPLLQPVAHSLVQSREEMDALLPGLSLEQLWTSPGGAASVGYHARHAAGALDRLFTYARGAELSSAQRLVLLVESSAHRDKDDAERLRATFAGVVEQALAQLRATEEGALLEPREVGRAKLPSTVIGLLFHGAEHTQRHVGQLTAIAKVVRAGATA
jgi:uncharacterized damage-inducible protein DinB